MNTNLLIDPIRAKELDLHELRELINAVSWSQFEAACYLSGKALLDFNEFQNPPPGYEKKLKELLENDSTDPDFLQAFQKYKTNYPDIDETLTALKRLSKGRMGKVNVDDKTKMITSAEPMYWIKLAMENNLWVTPGIQDAWFNFLHRPKIRYLLPKFRNKKSIGSESKKANSRMQLNTRPLHESADIDNIQELGRKLFHENLELSKQEIEEKIRKIYPRAKCYSPIVIVRWLTWANIARRKKGGHTNLPNEV